MHALFENYHDVPFATDVNWEDGLTVAYYC